MMKLDVAWKLERMLQIGLIVAFTATVATAASAEGSDRWWRNWSWSGSTSWGDHTSDDWRERYDHKISTTTTHFHTVDCGHDVPQHSSSIPEPSAALLFATGGLVVAQGIRNRSRRRDK